MTINGSRTLGAPMEIVIEGEKLARLAELLQRLHQAEMAVAQLQHEIETAFFMLDLDPDACQIDLSTGIVSPRAAQNGQEAAETVQAAS